MYVLACLPPDLLARVRQALHPSATLDAEEEWSELEPAWRRTPHAVLVLDPRMAVGRATLMWAARAPVILYTAFTPEAVKEALRMSRDLRGEVAIALRGHDDTPAQLQVLLHRGAFAGLSERVAALIAPRLADLAEPVRAAFRSALLDPVRLHTVEALALQAGVSPQRLRRCARDAGIPSPKALLTIGRVAWAYQYVRLGGISIRTIAARLGYAEQRDLVRHVRRITGRLPRDLRQLEEDELLAQLAALFRVATTDEETT